MITIRPTDQISILSNTINQYDYLRPSRVQLLTTYSYHETGTHSFYLRISSFVIIMWIRLWNWSVSIIFILRVRSTCYSFMTCQISFLDDSSSIVEIRFCFEKWAKDLLATYLFATSSIMKAFEISVVVVIDLCCNRLYLSILDMSPGCNYLRISSKSSRVIVSDIKFIRFVLSEWYFYVSYLSRWSIWKVSSLSNASFIIEKKSWYLLSWLLLKT